MWRSRLNQLLLTTPDGIKKKNEYELDEERMRSNSAQRDRDHPLILMKQPFMRIALVEPITLTLIFPPEPSLEEILVLLLHFIMV